MVSFEAMTGINIAIKEVMIMAIDRRQQVIEAAEKSFALFGYKATTMDQVAKIANVGKGTIYTFLRIRKSSLMKYSDPSLWK